ncbi:hypothetical protein BK004_04520 [bacterium CG10_46_32]|nr:MAG: hypothetical protein BK004_04520 [bacterium CG10_46_32]PIR55706.1 MAG: hypothetical protein COU73_04560 [Parcubacteria group bacterium CG10_big_fil_rev_8_21_14_0_10_46_32]
MKKYDFAFIVHPRSRKELVRSFPPFWFVPNFLLYLFSPRIIGDIVLTHERRPLRGALVGIVNVPAQFLKRDEKIKKKILSAIRLAQNYGANIVGLGSLSSPAVSGGLDIQAESLIAITNGNALTAAVVIQDVQSIAGMLQKKNKKANVAIIGATGSIGQAVSHAIAGHVDSLSIIARKKESLDVLADTLRSHSPGLMLTVSTTVADAETANIIVVATSHHETVLHSAGVVEGTVVYDITQPSNLKKSDWIRRDDVLVMQGGLVHFPGLQVSKITGLDDEESFACLAETALLSLAQRTSEDFSVGHVTAENIKKIEKLAKQHGVTSLIKKWNNVLEWDNIIMFIEKYA